jgi:hypothetical protein
MRIMVLVKATAESEKGFTNTPESAEMMAAMGRFNDDLEAAGILVEAAGLKPSSASVRLHFDGADRTATPGPFANPGELVAGFWIWEVADMEEALHWARRCPNPMPGPSDLELRPFYELDDLG